MSGSINGEMPSTIAECEPWPRRRDRDAENAEFTSFQDYRDQQRQPAQRLGDESQLDAEIVDTEVGERSCSLRR